jgi:peptidyl-prolyl cis-trans isomerase C
MVKVELDAAPDREKARPTAMRAAMERYITRELMYQEAEARGLRPDDAAVEQAYNQARLRHPRDDDWAETLQAQGFDPMTFRTELRIQATLALLGEEEARTVPPVTEEDAQAYYDAHREEFRFHELVVRHILFRILPSSAQAQIAGQRAKAQGVLFRVERGEKLSALAREFSDDAGSRDKGGELPPFTRGTTDPAFEAAAFALEPGQHSGIVESGAGLHILELVSKRPGGLPPYESLAPELKERLMKDRRADAVKRLEDRLRAKARIEPYL